LENRYCVQVLRWERIIEKHVGPSLDADFINKMEGGLQELDETAYWLELLVESGIAKEARLKPLMQETDELIAIFVTIVNKMKGKQK
jgi:four helix bundle protein